MEHFRHLANIGTHSLSYALRGTVRDPGSPLVIVLTGITSSALKKSAGCRSIESEAWILLYERAGYGRSEGSPNDPDSHNFRRTLPLIGSRGSRITVLGCRTFLGGMLAHEFIAARAVEEICGLVLMDPVQERMLFETWPDPSIAVVTADLDYMEADTEWSELIAEEASVSISQVLGFSVV